MIELAKVIERNLDRTDRFGGTIRVVSGGRRTNPRVVLTATLDADGRPDPTLSAAEATETHRLAVTAVKAGLRVDRSAGVAATEADVLTDAEAAELAAAIFALADDGEAR